MIPIARLLPRGRPLQWQVILAEGVVKLAVGASVALQEVAVSVPPQAAAGAAASESAPGAAAVVTV